MKVFFLCFAALFFPHVYAQTYYVKQLGIEQGLSNNNVVGITQDKDGFLWFATEEGLNKFDGSRFQNYYKYMNRLSGNELNDVYADPEQPIIWVATQRAGLNAYNYEEDKLTVYVHDDANPGSLATNDITRLYPAADGNLWMSTYHRGIEFFDKKTGRFTHYNTRTVPGLPNNHMWSVFDDGKGNIYAGHVGYGLSVIALKDKRIKNFRHHPEDPGSIPGDHVHCVYKDHNDNIWVGTSNGAALFNTETERFISLSKIPGGLPASPVFDMGQTSDHKLWIATELNGIYMIDLKQHFFTSPGLLSVQHIPVGSSPYSLSNPTVRRIFQDSFQNTWIGTYGGGIGFIGHVAPLFGRYSFSPISEDTYSLNNRIVLSLCTDAENRLWVGTDGGGINVFEKGKRSAILDEKHSGISHNSILSAYRDSQNDIWLGTFMKGVDLYDHRTQKIRRITLHENPFHDARCFYEDNQHDLWIGTNLGIIVIDVATKRHIRHYNKSNSALPDDFIRGIAQDSRGRMWIGTFGQGVTVTTPDLQPVAQFCESNGFCSNLINYIFKDSQERIWIGTSDGLACVPPGETLRPRVFGREEGIHNTHIRAITEDEAGNIWFSSNDGISCYVQALGEFRNYNSFDRIPMGHFSSGAVTRDARGKIYFGSINGAWYFDPATVLRTLETPPALITELRTFEGQSAQKDGNPANLYGEDGKEIRLNYTQNTFNIVFNVQDYALTDRMDYAYRLKGLDDSWHTVDENSVMFRNIPPGRYEFQVKTRIQNQEWSDAVQSLPVRITPPAWLSGWAKFLYTLLGCGLVCFLLYSYKKKVDMKSSYELEKKNREQEQELNHERLRFYTNITHELRTPLTLILGPLEDLEKTGNLPAGEQKKISTIHQSAIRLLNLINQLLEFRKVETQNKKLCVQKGNLAALVTETGLKYKELNRKAHVKFDLCIETDPFLLYMDKEIVTTILDNLLSNALKYTDEGRVSLSLRTVRKGETDYAEIKVADTGPGISVDELPHIFERYYQTRHSRQVSGTGIGLALVKNLAALHEGEIHVESAQHEGSGFSFLLLVHHTYPDALHADAAKAGQTEVHTGTASEEASEQVREAEKPILLVVEDNLDICEYIADSFSASFEVLTAHEGEAGYEAAFTRIPDIIVSDIMMPGMNGITFCKTLKEDIRTSHIPVILLTAKDSLRDKEEGYLAGADSYLTKPFSASLLSSRIHNLLESRKKLAAQFGSSSRMSEKRTTLHESLNRLDNEFIQQVTQIIEKDLASEKIDVSFLADKLCMSKSTLYRKIKALTGISTNEYIRKVKIQNAEKLILEGRYTVSEISFRVGISNVVYFRQCFKEEFGVSPTEYLKNLK